jgi:hypothetical protein
MSIPAGTCRLSFHGTLGGGQEIWQFSIWCGRDVTTQAGADDMAADADTAYITSNLKALTIASQDTYEGVSAYCYHLGGSVASFVGVAGSSSAGSTTLRNPMQVALVTTMETATPGRHGKGRIYLPCRITALGTDGLVSTANRDSILTQVKAVVQALNASAPSTLVGVVSQTTSAIHSVTAVSMDQRMDIQRRRANRQSVGARARQTV